MALLRAKDAFFAATNALPRETLALSCPMKTSIALLTIPESSGSLLYGMADLFVSVRRDWSQLVKGSPEPSPFEVHLTGRAVGPLRVANGMLVEVARTYDYFPDILCVPEVLVGPHEELGDRFTPELEYLRAARARGIVLATACTGAILLAEAGLLAGHSATTHWLWCDRLSRYPGVTVLPNQALVVSDEGRLVLGGGGTASGMLQRLSSSILPSQPNYHNLSQLKPHDELGGNNLDTHRFPPTASPRTGSSRSVRFGSQSTTTRPRRSPPSSNGRA